MWYNRQILRGIIVLSQTNGILKPVFDAIQAIHFALFAKQSNHDFLNHHILRNVVGKLEGDWKGSLLTNQRPVFFASSNYRREITKKNPVKISKVGVPWAFVTCLNKLERPAYLNYLLYFMDLQSLRIKDLIIA